MRAIRYLTTLGFAAALMAATPAAAVTTVKIIDSAGYWLNYTGYVSYGGLYTQVYGNGWACTGASSAPGQFLGGANGANCANGGSPYTVYKSGGEWFIDYP